MQIFELIRGWANDRGLIEGSTTDKQMLKLGEEFGELAGALARGNEVEADDAIGDMVVVLTILAAQRGVQIEACIEGAWIEFELEQWRQERNEALAGLDMDWARKMMPATDDHVRVMAMHKGRVECTDLAPELRHASVEWLRERGYKRMDGGELPLNGELPQ